MEKAYSLSTIDNAVRFDVPVNPKHPFYVDFSDVRGDFEEKFVYKSLYVNPKDFKYNQLTGRLNKSLLFLAGMRGSGKTTEIAKYIEKLNNPDCFFCVVCNIDKDLDTNDVEYMDILIFMIEKLVENANKVGLKLDKSVIKSMQDWFSQRITEINTSIKKEGGVGLEVELKTPSFLGIFNIASRLKAGIAGSKENAMKIRNTLKNRFNDFALKFNEFIENVNLVLKEKKMAREILFIIDGLEKTMSTDSRKKIIIHESNRLRQIKANTIFTLPVELMKEQEKLKMFSTVVSFPFVKIVEKDGTIIEKSVKRFEEFVHRRISEELFDKRETVRKAILFSGGSPRELLRILEYSNMYTEEDKGIITLKCVDRAIEKLSAQTSRYITPKEIEKLKVIKQNNIDGKETPFDEIIQDLLEKLIVFEYDDGSYKRVNPIVEVSKLYKQYVG